MVIMNYRENNCLKVDHRIQLGPIDDDNYYLMIPIS